MEMDGDGFQNTASEAEHLKQVFDDLEGRSRSFGAALTGALKSAAVDGKALEDVLRSLATRMRALIDDAPLVLDGAHLVSILHRATSQRRDGKSRFHRAELRFRAVTE